MNRGAATAESTGGVGERLLSTLLNEMDGIEVTVRLLDLRQLLICAKGRQVRFVCGLFF